MTTAEPPTDGTRAQDVAGEGIPVGLNKGRPPVPAQPSAAGPAQPPAAVGARHPGEPDDRVSGPAWIVVPARVIALVIVVPLRLVHDLLVLAGRGLRVLMRTPVGLVWLLSRIWGAFYRVLLGRRFAWLRRGFAWLGRGIGRGFVLLFQGLGWLLAVLVAMPAVLLWHYVLRPPLLGLSWLACGIGHFLAWTGRGIAWLVLGIGRRFVWIGRGIGRFFAGCWNVLSPAWNALAASMAWAWRLLGRGLAWLARVLLVLPALAVWRHLLVPIGQGVAWAWRHAARLLRWLWRTLVVTPVRVLVVAPARWVRTSVLRPIGHGIRDTWRTAVRDPLRSARRTVRETSREVRLTLRRTFRGR